MRGHNPIESPPVTRAITAPVRPAADPVPSLRAATNLSRMPSDVSGQSRTEVGMI